jgi:hypothetical protein
VAEVAAPAGSVEVRAAEAMREEGRATVSVSAGEVVSVEIRLAPKKDPAPR